MKVIKRNSIAIFNAVIFALFLREMQTRFGSQKFGYFWMIIDAITKVIFMSAVKYYLMGKDADGYDYVVFLGVSILTFEYFRNIVTKSMGAFGANAGLFIYKQVLPIDTVIARYLVETIVYISAFIFLAILGYYLDFEISAHETLGVLLTILWFSTFAFGFGLLVAVASHFYAFAKKVVNFIMLPLFILSGVFYTVDFLPEVIREYILYNPIIHFMELLHANYFTILTDKYVDYEYMTLWTIIPLFLGLYSYFKLKIRILTT
jgi:capsular polysaccharide transport system permease protein